MKRVILEFISNHKWALLSVFLIGFAASLIFCLYWITVLEQTINQKYGKVIEVQQETEDRIIRIDGLLYSLNSEVAGLTYRIEKLENHIRKVTYVGNSDSLEFDIDTDLKSSPTITVEQMERVITYWAEEGSPFIGNAQVFITAGQETGYSPLYIFAHAAIESGWGSSYLARTRSNYFGIGAYDSDPDAAYYFDEGFASGIIAGAHWIDDHYYKQGATTLSMMQAYGYASNPEWPYAIAHVIYKSLSILEGGYT